MITKKDLLDWLKSIDKNLNHKIDLIAVGGTAMTLLDLKPSTRDVDFCIDSKELLLFKRVSKNKIFKVDLFVDGFIFAEQLPSDYKETSKLISADFKWINLKSLSLIDIIITKAARYNERDEEDISTIINKNLINKQELITRFNLIRKSFAGNDKDYEYHFNLILKRHLK